MSDFASLTVSHLPRLRRYARCLLRDRTRADDLVQQTVVRALEKEHLFQRGTNLAGWLLTIMHNEHVNAVRRVTNRPSLVSDDEITDLGHSENQEAPVELREILRAVRRLPLEQREPLLLHWLHGLKYEEIARRMNLPMGTIQSRISRARQNLRVMTETPNSGLGLANRVA